MKLIKIKGNEDLNIHKSNAPVLIDGKSYEFADMRFDLIDFNKQDYFNFWDKKPKKKHKK